MADPNDAIQSLARIVDTAAQLMALMHRRGSAVDPQQWIQHMQANLDHVKREVTRG